MNGSSTKKDSNPLAPPAAQAGGDALAELYRRYWHELCKYLNRKFGSGPPDPEDIAQTAFAKFAALDKAQEIRNPRAFLYTTARNLVLDYKRKQHTTESYIESALHSVGEEILDQISPEHVLIEKERIRILADVMRRLPRKQQRIVALSRLQGKSYAEIARQTGWSQADISRQMTRIMKKLDAALAASGCARGNKQ